MKEPLFDVRIQVSGADDGSLAYDVLVIEERDDWPPHSAVVPVIGRRMGLTNLVDAVEYAQGVMDTFQTRARH